MTLAAAVAGYGVVRIATAARALSGSSAPD